VKDSKLPSECQVCGAKASAWQPVTRDGVPFFQRYRCSSCHAQLHNRLYQLIFLSGIPLGLVGVILLVANPGSRTGHDFLNFFWFTLFLYAAILPHELAHAWAGQLVGFRTVSVAIGTGATLFTFRGFKFPIHIKSIPFSGYSAAQPQKTDHLRLRTFVLTAAGPASNLLIAAVLWRATGHGPSFNSITSVFVLAHVCIGVASLLPFSSTSPEHGWVHSDGLSLLKLIFAGVPFFPQTRCTTVTGDIGSKVSPTFSGVQQPPTLQAANKNAENP